MLPGPADNINAQILTGGQASEGDFGSVENDRRDAVIVVRNLATQGGAQHDQRLIVVIAPSGHQGKYAIDDREQYTIVKAHRVGDAPAAHHMVEGAHPVASKTFERAFNCGDAKRFPVEVERRPCFIRRWLFFGGCKRHAVVAPK